MSRAIVALGVAAFLAGMPCRSGALAEEARDMLDEVLAAGKLVVAVDANYYPQSFIGKGGELDGFDVDVAREVARRLGVKVSFATPDWEAIVGGRWARRFDLSIGSMAPTAEREKVLWFTIPYYFCSASFVAHRDNTTIREPADLAAKSVGLCKGATYQRYLEANLDIRGGGRTFYAPPKGAAIKGYNSDSDALQELRLGDGVRLDAALMAKPMIEREIRDGAPFKIVLDPPFYEALAFALDRARGPSARMLARLDELIGAMHKDGTLRALSRKWFESDPTVAPRPRAPVLWLRPLGPFLAALMLLTGGAGVLCLGALRRRRAWARRPLTLAAFLLVPLAAGVLPLVEGLTAKYTWDERLWLGLPLLALAAWHWGVAWALTRPSALAAPEGAAELPLAERIMAARRDARARFGLLTAAVCLAILIALYGVLRVFELDVSFVSEWFPFVMGGAGLTLLVSALSIALASLLALAGALGRLSKNPTAYGVSSFYVSLFRGTPLILQIYICYFALPQLGVILPAVVAGVLALGANYGAYMTEIFRAGVEAVGKGQTEAAHALGMTRPQTLRRIVLPQAFRIVIPAVGNEFVAMLKDSALVGAMGVHDLMWRAQTVGRQNCKSLETLLIAGAFYWLLTILFQRAQGRLEARMAQGERR
ncbi:MAG: ABC transporter substrate-binding protein/permease [Planctomycetes bacterium]|nr:ABC transporter substrate-binding protein/permease [Planctomycetota bacterium]